MTLFASLADQGKKEGECRFHGQKKLTHDTAITCSNFEGVVTNPR